MSTKRPKLSEEQREYLRNARDMLMSIVFPNFQPPSVADRRRSLVERFRREQDLSLEELADRAGIALSALKDYLSGETKRLRPGSQKALAKVLGIPPADLDIF